MQETEYIDVQINTRPPSVFEAPQGFEKLAPPPETPPPPAVSKVADDVPVFYWNSSYSLMDFANAVLQLR